MAAAISVASTPSPVPAGRTLVIEATQQVSTGVNSIDRKWFRKVKTFGVFSSSPFVITSEYVALFGALKAGTKVFVRLRYISTSSGQASAWRESSVIVS